MAKSKLCSRWLRKASRWCETVTLRQTAAAEPEKRQQKSKAANLHDAKEFSKLITSISYNNMLLHYFNSILRNNKKSELWVSMMQFCEKTVTIIVLYLVEKQASIKLLWWCLRAVSHLSVIREFQFGVGLSTDFHDNLSDGRCYAPHLHDTQGQPVGLGQAVCGSCARKNTLNI